MDDLAHESVVDQLVDELMLRLSHLAQLAPAVIRDREEMCSNDPAGSRADGVRAETSGPAGRGDRSNGHVDAVGCRASGPPDGWSRTPLGALVSQHGPQLSALRRS